MCLVIVLNTIMQIEIEIIWKQTLQVKLGLSGSWSLPRQPVVSATALYQTRPLYFITFDRM